ncbi:MAG: 23S rRNA (guanosine(2251)-2'-O)-methyltransferase RlmB, partial [Gammaproteobacteria bacterium]|nr:23S rRNA (guanosine(2251)-2'-O)-methyltransferase RlmB [Gammaproteobacteria bacterium]
MDCPRHADYRDLPLSGAPPLQLLALDRVTNPQNLGMIVRTVCASPLDGLLLPRQGCAPLSPLVIKASAGTLFRCPLWRCDRLG